MLSMAVWGVEQSHGGLEKPISGGPFEFCLRLATESGLLRI